MGHEVSMITRLEHEKILKQERLKREIAEAACAEMQRELAKTFPTYCVTCTRHGSRCHVHALKSNYGKNFVLKSEIEELAATWRGRASETKPEGGIEQTTILYCVAGLMKSIK